MGPWFRVFGITKVTRGTGLRLYIGSHYCSTKVYTIWVHGSFGCWGRHLGPEGLGFYKCLGFKVLWGVLGLKALWGALGLEGSKQEEGFRV